MDLGARILGAIGLILFWPLAGNAWENEFVKVFHKFGTKDEPISLHIVLKDRQFSFMDRQFTIAVRQSLRGEFTPIDKWKGSFEKDPWIRDYKAYWFPGKKTLLVQEVFFHSESCGDGTGDSYSVDFSDPATPLDGTLGSFALVTNEDASKFWSLQTDFGDRSEEDGEAPLRFMLCPVGRKTEPDPIAGCEWLPWEKRPSEVDSLKYPSAWEIKP